MKPKSSITKTLFADQLNIHIWDKTASYCTKTLKSSANWQWYSEPLHKCLAFRDRRYIQFEITQVLQ